MFNYLKDPQTDAYDLVVFDEAHKLSADRQPDFRVRKTDRYKLAEALSGAEVDNEDWKLPWSAQHLLLLTATPHMGKRSSYYYLWRLLLPDALSTYDAFEEFPQESRQRHYIRRTKEEMVHLTVARYIHSETATHWATLSRKDKKANRNSTTKPRNTSGTITIAQAF